MDNIYFFWQICNWLVNLIKDLDFCYVLLIFINNNTWVIPLKDTKGVTITNAFQLILDASNRKPKNIWEDKGSEL